MPIETPERHVRIIDQEPKRLNGNTHFYPQGPHEIGYSWYADSQRGRFIPVVSGTLAWRETGEGREFYITTDENSYSGTHPFAIPLQVVEHIMEKKKEIEDPQAPLKLNALGNFTGVAQRCIELVDSLGKPVEFEFHGLAISATPGSKLSEIDELYDRLQHERRQAILKDDPDAFNRAYRQANDIPEPQPTT